MGEIYKRLYPENENAANSGMSEYFGYYEVSATVVVCSCKKAFLVTTENSGFECGLNNLCGEFSDPI